MLDEAIEYLKSLQLQVQVDYSFLLTLSCVDVVNAYIMFYRISRYKKL